MSRRSRIGGRIEPLEARVLLTNFVVESTADAGPGSLRQAIADANANPGADEIVFSGEVFSDASADIIQLTSGRITISDDLLILGPGPGLLTITAAGQSQLLYVTGAATDVTIEGLRLTGGNATGASLSTESGGAIFNDNSGLQLRHVELSGNTAALHGGALYNLSGTVHVIDSTIISNTTVRGGGGLANGGWMEVSGTHFAGNTARFGGAVAVGQTGTLQVQASSFTENFAWADGAGVYNYYGQTEVLNSTFQGNTAEVSGTVTNLGTLLVSGSTFDGNSAYYGAGVANGGGASLVISHSTFRNGSAGREGGAAINGGGTMTIINSLFENNLSVGIGGALALVRGGANFVSGTTFATNKADRGGAITNTHDSLLNIVNSTLSGNFADGAGGGIFNNGNMTLTNSTVVMNRSNADGINGGGGGGIYTNDPLTVQTRLFNTLIAGNRRGTSGSDEWNDVGGTKLVSPESAYNLISTPDASGGLTHGENGNIVGQSGSNGTRVRIPLLSLIDINLVDNGGSVPTHALIADSVAINAGSSTLAIDADGLTLLTDQRGDGFGRINGGAVDIGAYEV